MDKKKKTALITGGAGGLGRELAALLTGDYEVVVVDIDRNLEKVAKTLGVAGWNCDVSVYAQVERAIKLVVNRYGKIDVLINAAGVYLQGQLSACEPSEIEQVIGVNTLGTINMCRAVIPYMKKNGGGQIVNIISQAALYPAESRSVYHASKWAIDGFTKSLQPEVDNYGIKVTGVYPGLMKTRFLEKGGYSRNMETALDPEEVVKIINYILALPEDVLIPEIGIKHARHY